MDLPKKKYNIIYADPPWSYQGKMMNSSVTDHYSVMNVEQIAKLPIKNLADDDCALFMWVTFPKLNEFMKVLDGWGFEYKTTAFVWVKTNKSFPTKQTSFLPQDNFETFWGLGRWTRSNAEICILATKGKPKRQSNSVQQIVFDNIREHSRKPECVRDRIIELCGDLPRIELFAREGTLGWDVWGNQTNKY